MPELSRLKPQPDHRFAFLQGFLEHPKEVGSIIPSSRFLERRIVRSAQVKEAELVPEILTSMARAGADLIITYHAREALAAGWLR